MRYFAHLLKRHHLLFAALIVLPVFARSGNEKGSSRLKFATYNASTNNALFLEDNKFASVYNNLGNSGAVGFFDYSYKNSLVLGIDRSITSLGAIATSLSNNLYRAEVDVQIVYNQVIPNGTSFSSNMVTVTKTLKVDFSGFNAHTSASTPATEIELDAYNYTYGYQSLVTVTAVRIYNSPSSNTPIGGSNVPANLYLELQTDAERYYDLNSSAALPYSASSAITLSYLSGSSTGNVIEVNWQRIAGAEEYDLEWLWLDEYTYGNGSSPVNPSWANFPEISFRNNSTRIRTSQNVYRISHVYESGHLFVRLRAVGRSKTPVALVRLGNGPLSDSYTNWTWPDVSTVPSTAPNTSGGLSGSSSWPHNIDLRTTAHESNKNWVYKASFAEEGKKAEVVSYFDGAQYSRQTVTRNNSEQLAVVAETYYDFAGRPAVQALPTPVNDATIKFYQQTVGTKLGFNFDQTTDSAFTKRVFALASGPSQCALTLAGFDSNYGTGKYYSANNTFMGLNYNAGYTPKADNFPFVQTEYTPDNSGRVARKSGVGSVLKLENAVGVPKRDTRSFYGAVSQEELDRLFGSEVGYASHYSKTMVVDPNNQVSLSYINQEGKVVATALSGTKPGNLQPLLAVDGVTDLSTTSATLEQDLLNKASTNAADSPQDNNQRVNNELVYNEKILVSSAQIYYFDYSVKGSSFAGCGSRYYDCVYDMEFDIRDACGNRPSGFNPVVYSLGNISGSSPNFVSTVAYDATAGNNAVDFKFQQILPPPATSLAVNLDIGEYTVTKRLKVNQEALQAYLNDYLQNCATSPNVFDANEQPNFDASGCEMDCKECAQALGDLNTFKANNPNLSVQEATNQYNEFLKACYEPCSYESNCETALQSMLSDMSPRGQYAEYSLNNGSADGSAYPLSIYNSSNSLPKRSLSVPPTWRSPLHYAISPVAGASGYLDEFGLPDKVSVFETAVGSGVYVPPVVAGAILGPGPGTNEFYAKPEGLANTADFIALFKPSWAQSLVKYHPEYAYIEWCLKNRLNVANVPVKIKNYDYSNPQNVVESGPPTVSYITSSDLYDSLLTSIDDIDDISTVALPAPYASYTSLNVLFNPFAFDPYWDPNTGNAFYYIAASGNPVISLTPPYVISNPCPALNAAPTNGYLVPQLQNANGATPADFSAVANMYANRRGDKTANQRFYNYAGSGLTIYQYAALISTPLVMQYGQPANALLTALNSYYTTAPVNPQDYILNLIDPANPTDDTFKRKAWENYKTAYLAMKQQLQQEAAQSYVMNGPARGCSDCIGKADFDLNSVKYTTYGHQFMQTMITSVWPNTSAVSFLLNLMSGYLQNWYIPYSPSLSPFNADQVCGTASKDLYANKVKRYYVAEDAVNLLPGSDGGFNNTQAAIYAQTGLCPNAYDFQNFLNAMVANGNSLFNLNKNLSTQVPAFSQGLYQAIVPNNIIPSPFVNAYYNYSSSSGNGNKSLVATISIGSSQCNITLNLPVSVNNPIPANIALWASYPSLYKINQFINFTPTGGTGNFQVDAIVSTVGANPVLYTITLTGNACNIDLSGCSFVPPCKPNAFGKSVGALLDAFAANYSFPAPVNNGNYISGSLLTPAPSFYANVFVNSLKPLLETNGPVNSWQWTYNPSLNEILVTDGGSNTNKRLKITLSPPFSFLPGPNSNNTAPSLSCVRSIQNLRPDPSQTGYFIADGITDAAPSCQSGTLILKGTVQLGTYAGGNWSYLTVDVGRCSFDLFNCNTKEHEAKRDLESWVLGNSGFVNMITSGSPVNISGNLAFTGLLRSYLNSGTGSNASGPIQNFYHWVPDAVNTNNNQVCGWITVSQSPSAPNPVPAGSCYFSIKKITPLNGVVNPNSVSSLLASNIGNLFELTSTGSTNANIYSFKLLTDNLATDDSLLCTTTCFPLRDCENCTGSTVVSNPNNNLQFTIQDFSCGTYPYSLFDDSGNAIPIICDANSPVNVAWSNPIGIQNYQFTTPLLGNIPTYAQCIPPSCPWIYSPVSTFISSNGPLPYSPPQSSPGSLLWFSYPNCATGNCCTIDPERKTTYQQTFNIPTAGFYFIRSMYDVPYQSGASVCNVPTNYLELDVYVDNVLISEIQFPAGNGLPSGGSVWLNTPKVQLSAGNHNLKFIFHSKVVLLISRLHRIYVDQDSGIPTSIPCVNTPWPTDTMPTTDYEEPCAPYLQDLIDNTADEKYDVYLEALKAQFIKNYTDFCLGSANENLKMKYNNSDYHFTLYYYDQAGNLVRTVPPQGVKPIALGSTYSGSQTNGAAIKEDRDNYSTPSYTKKVYTQHKFLTTYTYNSLNQLVRQETPDAGVSNFFYDNLGRLVASQNAEQAFVSSQQPSGNQKYSYTRYDALGRIVMVGQLGTYDLNAYPGLPQGQTVQDLLSVSTYPFNLSIAANSHVEVTQTYYGDDPAYTALIPGSSFSTGFQQNLRGRVASVTIEDSYDGQNNTYAHGTHYSYDIHGNVKELVQHNPELIRFYYMYNQALKRIEYDYDLVSGKVNRVTYQRNEPDMLVHRYLYDASNRITNVYTSRNGQLWDQDAKYYYYLHGPLARTELGHHKVQAADYAYTLQGWLKGVNSEGLKADRDMGKDGYSTLGSSSNPYNLNRYAARDAYGYALNYFTNASASPVFDYRPINAADASPGTYFLANLGSSYGINQLFNGNITGLSAGYLNPSPTPINLTSLVSAVTVNKYDPYTFMKLYTYDQLNRIRSARLGAKAVDASNNWMYTNLGNLAAEFSEDFKYDLNGNILKANRSLISGAFDNLSYYYYDENGTAANPVTAAPAVAFTNKLAYVTDSQGASVGDIGNQAVNNYVYDKIGNLVSDAAENISSIKWTLYCKIKAIKRNVTSKPDLEFRYDAAGNRIAKTVTDAVSGITTITYYVRDAQGNIMATYNETVNGNARTFRLAEHSLYGSNRLGTRNSNSIIGYNLNGQSSTTSGMVTTVEDIQNRGLKSYELSNHLGNVLAVVSDRKFPVDDGVYNASGVKTSGTADGICDYFYPELTSATDYYAFGAPMPGRQFNNGNYRYGFNGKENDNEVKGNGGQQDYGFRIYDNRLGKFLSVDPLTKSYPELTPYQFAGNTPIQAIDLDGLEPAYAIYSSGSFIPKMQVQGSSTIISKIPENAIIKGSLNPAPAFQVTPLMLAEGRKILMSQPASGRIDYSPIDPVTDIMLGGALYKSLSKPSSLADDAAKSLIRQNAEKGAKFEQKVLGEASETQVDVVEQITVKTQSGTKTRIDIVGKDKATGQTKLTEAKSSATAPLTKNQKIAFPEIEQTGATVVGKGKDPFVGGTKIPPTKVNVVRPKE